MALHYNTPFESTSFEELKNLFTEALELPIEDGVRFSELAIDSLQSLHLTKKIAEKYNVKLSIQVFYSDITLKELYRKIKEKQPRAIELSSMEETSNPTKEISESQKSLLYLHEKIERKSAYNVYRVYRIKGNLQVERLSKVIQAVLVKNDAFRMNFVKGKAIYIIQEEAGGGS